MQTSKPNLKHSAANSSNKPLQQMNGVPPTSQFQSPAIAALSALAGAAAAWCGGWPAVLLLAITLSIHTSTREKPPQLLLYAIPGFWLLLQYLSGDRRLFFAWTMGLAATAVTTGTARSLTTRIGSGILVTAAFLAIRLQQLAPGRVLIIETLAAAAILATTATLHGRHPQTLFSNACNIATASILACFSLAI
jgi:hypothetical protein